jgi:hypothetical protein
VSDILLATFRSISDDRVLAVAAGVAFYGLGAAEVARPTTFRARWASSGYPAQPSFTRRNKGSKPGGRLLA